MADALGTGGGVVSALDHRLDQGGLLALTGGALDVRTGVMHGPGTTALVTGTTATSPMSYSIAAHHWVTTRGAADGVYVGTREDAGTVPTTAAPGSNSRIDIIWVRQADAASTISPDGTTAAEYGVTQGSAAVSPTAPSIPAGAVELARATVAAGAASTDGAGVTITNTARQTAARGAPIPVRSQAERDALTAYPGLHVLRLDLAGRLQWCLGGSSWATLATTLDLDTPYVQVKQDTAQIIPLSTWTTVTMDGETLDSHGWHSNTVNNTRVTADRACVVRVGGSVPFLGPPGTSTTRLGARITKNGAIVDLGGAFTPATGGVVGQTAHTPQPLVQLAAGDYLELQTWQEFTSTGGGLSTRVTDDHRPQMSVDVIRLL